MSKSLTGSMAPRLCDPGKSTTQIMVRFDVRGFSGKDDAMSKMERQLSCAVSSVCYGCLRLNKELLDELDHLTATRRLGIRVTCNGRNESLLPGNLLIDEFKTIRTCPDGYIEQGNFIEKYPTAFNPDWMGESYAESVTKTREPTPPPRNKDRPQVAGVFW